MDFDGGGLRDVYIIILNIYRAFHTVVTLWIKRVLSIPKQYEILIFIIIKDTYVND
jgi:hypothetical protein